MMNRWSTISFRPLKDRQPKKLKMIILLRSKMELTPFLNEIIDSIHFPLFFDYLISILSNSGFSLFHLRLVIFLSSGTIRTIGIAFEFFNRGVRSVDFQIPTR